jgi:Cysteine-rich CPXCG
VGIIDWDKATKEISGENLSMFAAGFQCAGCGEWVETTVDESGGSKQQYVEDCQVCCQPNVLTVRWDGSAHEFTIVAELES